MTTEALVGSLIVAVVGLSLLTGEVESARRARHDEMRESVASVIDGVLSRFSRSRDGVEAFLQPVPGEPARLRGKAPWRWSPELDAGLPDGLLDAWERDRALEIVVELAPEDLPGLECLSVTARWQDPVTRGERRLRRVQFLLAAAS